MTLPGGESASVQIAPSILSCDFGHLADQLAEIEQGGADFVHVDVMDGQFVPNITFGPVVLEAIRRYTSLPLDVHLMITQPDRYLTAFAEAGADLLTVHWEACTHLERTVTRIHEVGCLAGVAVNPATPVALLADIVPELDWILIMSVNPGFGGQQFWAPALHKVEQACRLRNERDRPRIAIDGGINPQTGLKAHVAGADVLVSGSGIFGSGDPRQAIKDLRAAVTDGRLKP